MGDLEISIDEGKTTNNLQNYERRSFLRRWLPEGIERHRAANMEDCDFSFLSVNEASFNRLLRMVFLFTLTLAVILLLILETVSNPPVGPYNKPPLRDYISAQTWLFGHFQIRQKEIVFLAVLVGVSVWKMRQKTSGSGAPRRGEEKEEKVQTLSALVQQV